MDQRKKDLPALRRSGFNPWIGKIPLEKEMATRSSTPTWKIPRTEKPGGLQSMGLQRVGLSDFTFTFILGGGSGRVMSGWKPKKSYIKKNILFNISRISHFLIF